MDYITTTDLRTKSSQLVTSLQNGTEISLIHRSKIVGVIKPIQKSTKPLTQEDIDSLKRLAKAQNAPRISYKERERIYRRHLMEKYGKGLS